MPRFVHTLEDQVVQDSDTATFSCQVYPQNAPVRWFMKGREIKQGQKYTIEEENDVRRLLVKYSSDSDAGEVSVKLADDVTSRANLTVEGEFLQRTM